MSSTIKTFAGRGLYLIAGIALILLGLYLLKTSWTYSSPIRYIERREEKDFLIAGLVVTFIGIASFSFAVSKRKDWKNDTVKFTGIKINNNREANIVIENFTIEPLMTNSIYKYIKANAIYHGEQKELKIYLAETADYDKIANANKINLLGEFTDEVYFLYLSNARLVNSASTIIA